MLITASDFRRAEYHMVVPAETTVQSIQSVEHRLERWLPSERGLFRVTLAFDICWVCHACGVGFIYMPWCLVFCEAFLAFFSFEQTV